MQPNYTVAPVRTADWQALGRGIGGELVLSEDAGYDQARHLADLEFDRIRPQAIVYCTGPADVAEAIAFARRFGIPAVPRSGGHSFAGYSTSEGMVIDVSLINAVRVADAVVRAGPGAQIIDMYEQTLSHGVVVPTGWCPTVGIGGLALGGGLGIESRRHGLTVDNVLEIETVLADGRLVRCDDRHHPDLFWALRGAGGGNFGIAVDFTLRSVPANRLTNYSLRWPWSQAATVVHAWQRWAAGSPDEMTPVVTIELDDSEPGNEPGLDVHGAWFGPTDRLDRHLEQLVDMVGLEPASTNRQTLDYLDGMMQWFGCEGMTPAECHLIGHNPAALLPRVAFARGRGSFFRTAVPPEGIAAMMARFQADRQPHQQRILEFLTMGGAINRVAPDATAFVHRDSMLYVGYAVGMMAEREQRECDAAVDWVNSCWTTMQPWSSGHAYQNFSDPALPDWRQAYYGANYPRLTQVRAEYDPDRFFQFPQAIG